MENSEFNPYEWIQTEEKPKKFTQERTARQSSGISNDCEVIINRIEEFQLDLTINYRDWLLIGFAIADEFGELGREYFHRVSRFYQGYDSNECNDQYDKCLRGKKGISIRTFYYLAQCAGIDIKVKRNEHQ